MFLAKAQQKTADIGSEKLNSYLRCFARRYFIELSEQVFKNLRTNYRLRMILE